MKSQKSIIACLLMGLSMILFGCASTEDSGTPELMQIVLDFKGMDADTLYDKVEVWCAKKFVSLENDENSSSINYKNKESHSLSGIYMRTVSYAYPNALTGAIDAAKYNVDFQTKDEKVRVTMQLDTVRFQSAHVAATNKWWIVAGLENEEKSESKAFFREFVAALQKELGGANDDW